MAQISITKTYANGQILVEADLDNIKESVETFINITGINDDNLQNGGITASSKLVDASITLAKMAANSVDTNQLVDDAVDKDKIAADVAGLGLVQNVDGSLEVNPDDVTIELSGDNVQIKDDGVTQAKLADRTSSSSPAAAGAVLVSGSSGTFSTTSTVFTNVTNLSGDITTTGRPVKILLIASGNHGTNASFIQAPSSTTHKTTVEITREGSSIAEFDIKAGVASNYYLPPSAIEHMDTPAAGTYTYAVNIKTSNASFATLVYETKLAVYEV